MDIATITAGIQGMTNAIGLLKSAKDMLPNGAEKKTAEAAIQQAEQGFQAAQAQIAQSLGYQICKCTWPPQIMLTNEGDRNIHKCPKCGIKVDTSPVCMTVERPSRRRFFDGY